MKSIVLRDMNVALRLPPSFSDIYVASQTGAQGHTE